MTGCCNKTLFDIDDDQTLGFDWGSVTGPAISAGVQTGLSWLFGRGGSSGSNCLVGQVSGDEAMTNCVPRVMAMFDELESVIGLYPAELIIGQANQIASVFSDPRYFDQSIGGRSREIREAAKLEARQRADQIIAFVGGNVPVTSGTPTNGGQQSAVSGQTGGGQQSAISDQQSAIAIDTKTVLLAGGGLVLLLLLLKS